ncbi:MAG TPA: hypothetical protein VJ302_05850 [Blastocatellia bacterium]|nr:hypothetical protein [Blastocatellia bacterium]
MSTINFTFEDLCAFFTKYPSRLMVGMISTEDEAPENVHRPHIVIKENGVVKREYRDFTEIHGDITLDVYPKGEPFKNYVPKSRRDARQSPDYIVDIEKQLYPREKMKADAKACRARFYFNNGEFYTITYHPDTVFADEKTQKPSGHKLTAASKVGLDIEIPAHGYAVLHFEGDTEDFVFKGGRNYEVEIVNRAEAMDFRHFGYFYKIVKPKPKQRLVPISAGGWQGAAPTLGWGNYYCMGSRLSKSEYPMPKSRTKK